MFTFWCILADGRHNSITADTLYDAPRRARAIGAVKLFCKNPVTGVTFEMNYKPL